MTLFIYDQIWDDLGIPDSVQALKSSADVALPVSASCTLEQVEEISKLTAQHEAVPGIATIPRQNRTLCHADSHHAWDGF